MSNNKQTAVEWLESQLNIWQAIADDETNLTLDTVRKLLQQAKAMEKEQRKIEFPSDKEIKEYTNSIRYYGHCTSEYCEGIEDGIKYVINKIQGDDK